MSVAITSWLGEGARPLKKDYSIASDSHFKKEKLSQCVLTVCASWSHYTELERRLCLYSARSRSGESVASDARSYTTMLDSGDALQSDSNPSKHERLRCQVDSGVITNGSVSSPCL